MNDSLLNRTCLMIDTLLTWFFSMNMTCLMNDSLLTRFFSMNDMFNE